MLAEARSTQQTTRSPDGPFKVGTMTAHESLRVLGHDRRVKGLFVFANGGQGIDRLPGKVCVRLC